LLTGSALTHLKQPGNYRVSLIALPLHLLPPLVINKFINSSSCNCTNQSYLPKLPPGSSQQCQPFAMIKNKIKESEYCLLATAIQCKNPLYNNSVYAMAENSPKPQFITITAGKSDAITVL
jgi:hypothetical protein